MKNLPVTTTGAFSIVQSQTKLRKGQPKSICILRLSALGDVTHVLPLINRLSKVWPETKLTWVVGSFEHKLVCDLPNVELIKFDKRSGWRGVYELWQQLRRKRFDVLLHMQVSLRANVISSLIRAPVKIGFDPVRSKDLHGLFVNSRIPAGTGEHVVEAFQKFGDTLGAEPAELQWPLSIPEDDYTWAREQLGGKPSVLISPCSSHKLRNWHSDGYAEVADYIFNNYGLQVVLCGGSSEIERTIGDEILEKTKAPVLDMIGRDTIKRMLAMLSQCDLLVSPDSGPAHMATCTNTPVIGLFSASNPWRSGPYLSREWCVDTYNEACVKFHNLPSSEIPWGTKVEKQGVMRLISTDAVIERIDTLAEEKGWPRSQN